MVFRKKSIAGDMAKRLVCIEEVGLRWKCVYSVKVCW